MGSGINKRALGSILKISGFLGFTNVKFVYNVKSDATLQNQCSACVYLEVFQVPIFTRRNSFWRINEKVKLSLNLRSFHSKDKALD